jgi:hypothetical protein
MMTVFVTSSCDVGYSDDSICNLITWQGYKYCHHCTQHHMTRLQIMSSLYPTSCWVQWWQYLLPRHVMLGTMMTLFVTTQHRVTRIQMLLSLYPTSPDKVTNTVIIVPNIAWQGYTYCHHCPQHHMTRLQILPSLYPTSHDKVTNTVVTLSCDVRYNDDSICNLVMWCWVQWWQYL